MKISSLMHFTENHRFYVFRDFSLGTLDYKMLSSIYQPMVGACAIGLYTLMHQYIPAEKTGFSPLEQQRMLFLALDVELNERGKKYYIDQTSKLEAVGLLQTNRKFIRATDEYVYEYQLIRPLTPNEFFTNQHFVMLLRDKLGTFPLLSAREELNAGEPEELSQDDAPAENLSVHFYDLFTLNTQAVDYELEQALQEIAPARQSQIHPPSKEKEFTYTEIIMRYPRDSYNRAHVEALKNNPDQLAAINYTALKYRLSLQETCRLLDEDDAFTDDGSLQIDNLQYKANLHFRQGKKREDERERYLHKASALHNTDEETELEEEKTVEMSYYLDVPPMLQEACDVHEYNAMLRNEPYTRVLKRFFPGSVPDRILDIFERIDLNYRLKEEVTNVLIHYLKAYNLSWTKPFIESIVSDMLGKQVETYEQAVQYIREQAKAKGSSRAGKGKEGARGKGKQKPNIPIVAMNDPMSLSEEEYEEILTKARRLDKKLKG